MAPISRSPKGDSHVLRRGGRTLPRRLSQGDSAPCIVIIMWLTVLVDVVAVARASPRYWCHQQPRRSRRRRLRLMPRPRRCRYRKDGSASAPAPAPSAAPVAALATVWSYSGWLRSRLSELKTAAVEMSRRFIRSASILPHSAGSSARARFRFRNRPRAVAKTEWPNMKKTGQGTACPVWLLKKRVAANVVADVVAVVRLTILVDVITIAARIPIILMAIYGSAENAAEYRAATAPVLASGLKHWRLRLRRLRRRSSRAYDVAACDCRL